MFARDGESFADAGLRVGEATTVHVLEHELEAPVPHARGALHARPDPSQLPLQRPGAARGDGDQPAVRGAGDRDGDRHRSVGMAIATDP